MLVVPPHDIRHSFKMPTSQTQFYRIYPKDKQTETNSPAYLLYVGVQTPQDEGKKQRTCTKNESSPQPLSAAHKKSPSWTLMRMKPKLVFDERSARGVPSQQAFYHQKGVLYTHIAVMGGWVG